MLARALVDAGHEATSVGLYHHAYPAPEYEEDHGVRVWRFKKPTWPMGWVRGRYDVFKKIANLARNNEIDLVEVADYGGPAAMWPKLKVPVIARLHGSATYFAAEMNTQVPNNFNRLERASLQRVDHICSVSEYTARRTKEVFDLGDDPTTVLYNFIDSTSSESSSQRKAGEVVYSGTLTYKKGVVPLIKAWPSVIARQKATLHVYGKDGVTSEGTSMKEMLLSHLDPSEQATVRFHGHTPRSELLGALQHASVGVFPSYAESFGLAPAESMAAACPTIYSSRGCGGELVRNEQDGLLIDPDHPDQIADAIVRLLEDQSFARELGQAGRRPHRTEVQHQGGNP